MSDIITWSPGITLDQIERQVILKAFDHFRKNKTVTSNALGISIRTLDNKLDKYLEEDKVELERQNAERAKRSEQLARSRGNPPNNIGLIYNPSTASQPSQASMQHNSSSSNAGVRMEPSRQSAQKHEMPMSEPTKVQTVLPHSPATSHKRK